MRLGDRGDDLVDPLGPGGVARERAAAGRCSRRSAASLDQRGDRRVVGQDVRGEHLQRQRQGVASHCWAASTCTAAAALAEQSPSSVDLDLDVDDAGPLLLDVQHRGRVHDQADVGEHRRPALVEVDEQLDGLRDRALGVADAQPHRRAAHRAADVGERQPGDDGDAVVRQRVAEHRGGGDLDGDRRRAARRRRPARDRQWSPCHLSTGSAGSVRPMVPDGWGGCDAWAVDARNHTCVRRRPVGATGGRVYADGVLPPGPVPEALRASVRAASIASGSAR